MTVEHGVSFADLHLWFAGFLPGFCRVVAGEGVQLAADGGRWLPFGIVREGSFAYRITRPTPDNAGVEFGAASYGPPGGPAARVMVDQVQAWDGHVRHGPDPGFSYWPNGVNAVGRFSGGAAKAATLIKKYGVVTICWPAS